MHSVFYKHLSICDSAMTTKNYWISSTWGRALFSDDVAASSLFESKLLTAVLSGLVYPTHWSGDVMLPFLILKLNKYTKAANVKSELLQNKNTYL